MNNSTLTNLIHERDQLRREIVLQREKIAQQLLANKKDDEDRFPRSNIMRLIYGTKGLMTAQLLFKMFSRNNPRPLSLVKTVRNFLLRRSG